MEMYAVGIQIHAFVKKFGFISNVYIGSALLDMYSKCLALSSAHYLFDEMPWTNEVTWNSLISGYLNAFLPDVAIGLFIGMLRVGMSLTPYSISAGLVGCAQLGDAGFGSQVHGLGLKLGFESNPVVATGLVDMYSKVLDIEASRMVFNRMPDKNVNAWTSLITGYANGGLTNEAMLLLKGMFSLVMRATDVTYNCLLSALTCLSDLNYCREIHCRIVKEGFESDSYIAVTLLTVYPAHGCSLKDFYNILSNVTVWDQISWNAVIAGLSTLGICEEAEMYFSHMRRAGVPLDAFTYVSILKATGTSTALKQGRQTHGLILKSGYASNLCVQNGLVSMYARCGSLKNAKEVFLSINERDVISWNSLLSGCGHQGYGKEAIELFEEMRKTSTRPNLTTFLIVLSACSHFGLLEKGIEYFELMRKDECLSPNSEHYTCMVDLYGRAGHLHEAEAFISNILIDVGPSVYKALLSACQIHGNKEIAVRAAKSLAELCPNDPANYVVISNILATEGNWKDAACWRKLMHDRGVRKISGFSRI